MGFFTKKWDIKSIKTWPPGAFMAFDNRQALKNMGNEDEGHEHVAIGMVVANDGEGKIRVLWGANCSRPFLTYDVEKLNPNVIRRVG